MLEELWGLFGAAWLDGLLVGEASVCAKRASSLIFGAWVIAFHHDRRPVAQRGGENLARSRGIFFVGNDWRDGTSLDRITPSEGEPRPGSLIFFTLLVIDFGTLVFVLVSANDLNKKLFAFN